MTTIYKVEAPERISASHPLHVDRFYPDLTRRHRRLRNDRQELILYLAGIYEAATKSGYPHAFCRIPMRLTSLRDWVYDYKVVFDRFFDIAEIGFHFGDEKHDVSYIIPKPLAGQVADHKLRYKPPPRPDVGAVSKVHIRQHAAAEIRSKLLLAGRFDLHAPVEWLLSQPEVNFHFVPCGKLKLRDTSVWPIPAIETWPAWLREELFGAGIDIESAYTQFLIEHIRDAYSGDEGLVRLLYPDLIRSLEDKKEWRREMCVDVLGLPYNEENIGVVKNICMSLANGSKVSPAILTAEASYSMTREIILDKVDNTSVSNLTRIGRRLATLGRQYSHAKKVVCNLDIGFAATKRNQKKVFATYFQWEREARYAIWNAVECHGIMVHDGIDGIPERYLQDIPALVKSLNLRMTRS